MMIDDDDDDDDDSLSSDLEEDEKSSSDFFSLENPETEREFFRGDTEIRSWKVEENEQRFAIFLASTFARRSRAGERATATEGGTGKTSFVIVVEEERWWW